MNNDTEPIFFFFLYFKGQISSQLFSAMFFSKIFLFKEKREECTQKQQQQKTSTILSPALSIRFRVFRYIYFSTKKKKKLRNEKRKKKTQKEENKIAFHLFLSNTIRFVYNFVSVWLRIPRRTISKRLVLNCETQQKRLHTHTQTHITVQCVSFDISVCVVFVLFSVFLFFSHLLVHHFIFRKGHTFIASHESHKFRHCVWHISLLEEEEEMNRNKNPRVKQKPSNDKQENSRNKKKNIKKKRKTKTAIDMLINYYYRSVKFLFFILSLSLFLYLPLIIVQSVYD